MFRKKNKRHIQSTPPATSASANETQSRSLTVTDTELQELTRQGFVVDEVHKGLEYDRKSMSWVDNFIRLSIELEKQSNDLREKSYHALMREVFSVKAFYEPSIQAGLISKAQYFGNKNRQSHSRIYYSNGARQKRMVKPWISCDIAPGDNYEKSNNIAKNKGPESRGQIIVSKNYTAEYDMRSNT